MWGARGSFPPAAAMVVMVAVSSWSLGHVSTVGIVTVFYGIILFFGHKYLCQHKIYSPCPDRVDRFILFVNILHLFLVYSGINCENKFNTNFGSHPLGADFLTKTGIDVKYSTNTIEWFDNELPLRDPHSLTDKDT